MGAEARLYKKLKNVSKDIVWTRIENQSLFGTPDLLGYNSKCTFFTVELKVANGNFYCILYLIIPKNIFR
jgi:hypothetical protein